MPQENITCYCRSCEKNTYTKILTEDIESHREEYQCDIIHQVVQCKGCDTKSFRKVFVDIEAAYPTYNDEWEVPEDITIYPKTVEGHREVDDISDIPDVVRTIYSEILLALKEDANILAGLGLRAAVEAVCNNLVIAGKSLEVRINKLTTAGYISKKDAERLHAIRFMGNDAAHDIKPPKKDALTVALQIVEHLIASVYILEKKVNGTLETVTSKYDVFKDMLEKKLDNFNNDDEYPIAKLLGKDLRRVKESIHTLEQELIKKIEDGEFSKLSVGKVEIFQGSKEPLQHFKVIKS